MAKPKEKPALLAPRKPPPPEVIEAFIGGQEINKSADQKTKVLSDKNVSTSVDQAPRKHGKALPQAPKGKGVVKRASGKVLRRLTVYLDHEMAKQLLLHAVEEGIDASTAVGRAVEKYLAGKGRRQ